MPAVFHCVETDHQNCINKAISHAEELCQQQGKRLTAIRRRVLELIWQQHKPVGAYELLEMLQQQQRCAPPTVYRALDFLLDLGLVHRIASLNAYVGCSRLGSKHHGQFLICEQCHALAELDIPEITAAIAQKADVSGFIAGQQIIEVLGLCPDCRQKNSENN